MSPQHAHNLCSQLDENGSPMTFSRAVMPVALLFGAFVAVVLWFSEVDFYHRHFFDTGKIVLADNALRVVFGLILCWLIYAPGASILALIARRRTERTAWSLCPAERALLGFGIGIGVWHVILLIVGVLGLYYRSVMIVLCAATLAASARHFCEVSCASWRAILLHVAELRSGRRIPQTVGAVIIVLTAFCLLLVRGLYPGGGGDYYTHYFYYYLEVLKNHSLAPNDVWYHYWYSKGCGLFFLGMLLTDPETPALVTFCCVAFAALAIAVLVARMAPASLWPMLAALLYLTFNIVSISRGGGGEFQKDHEQISALLVLVAWALCMEHASRDRLFLIMAGAAGVAAAIITQSMGILITFFVGLLAIVAMMRKRWRDMWAYGLCATVVGAPVFAIFLLGYVATGLATDQPLEPMLRFADMAKLDQWGVIPQIIIIAWGRDNYETLAPAGFDWSIFTQLAYFVRLDVLRAFFFGIQLFGLCALAVSQAASRGSALASEQLLSPAPLIIRATITRLGLLLVMLVVISIVGGRVQSVSYERFSTFFVPLLSLLTIAASSWLLIVPFPNHFDWVRRLAAPVFVLFLILVSWQITNNWAARVAHATVNGLRFFTGKYSLAMAYSHQDIGLPFGGINPGAFAAWRHAESGAPIWATNVDSYCMAPDCVIESIASFKLSPHFDEIVTGSPELAKRLLQEAGVNYFLFMKDARLLDLLPYSQLFAPDTIGRYLGVKWTDGSAYLLTWIGPNTRPLPADFYDAYAEKLAEPEHPWFRYSALAKEIRDDTALLRAKKWGAAPAFHWREAPQTVASQPGRVYIIDATYGHNCRWYRPRPPVANVFHEGNWTASLREECDSKMTCSFRIGPDRLGDPAGGCRKDFSATYRCGPDGLPITVNVPAEAQGHIVRLDCAPGIYVIQAEYGRSCWNFRLTFPARLFAERSVDDAVLQACNGKTHCDFPVDVDALGNRTNVCHNDFSLKYACVPRGTPKSVRISSPTAGNAIALDCPEVSNADGGGPH
jgi:hypothetical protein